MAAPDNLKSIRTMEDVSYMLNILFTNLNNLDATYYDMFINPTPMDIELERYNENGELVKVTLPNRAKDIISAYSGTGNPNGKQVANIGAHYIDTLNGYIYYKSSGSDAYGWILIWTSSNLLAGVNYLAPNGDGSQLTNLSATSIGSGTLPVQRGGTGVNAISGILKGNGISPISQAVDGIDFLGPNAFTGLIAYFPTNNLPTGWLRLDGGSYSRTTYSKLYNIIGTTYGSVDEDHFNVPNALGLFIRCWDNGREFNTIENGKVGTHNHSLEGCATLGGSPHTHDRGTLDIVGEIKGFYGACFGNGATGSGAFYNTSSWSAMNQNQGSSGDNRGTGFKASKGWQGALGEESTHTHTLTGSTANNATNQENIVKNIAFVPMIKY